MIISYTFLNDAVRDSPDNFSAWGTCLPERLSLVLINLPDNLFEAAATARNHPRAAGAVHSTYFLKRPRSQPAAPPAC